VRKRRSTKATLVSRREMRRLLLICAGLVLALALTLQAAANNTRNASIRDRPVELAHVGHHHLAAAAFDSKLAIAPRKLGPGGAPACRQLADGRVDIHAKLLPYVCRVDLSESTAAGGDRVRTKDGVPMMPSGCVSYFQGGEAGPGYVAFRVWDGWPLMLTVDAAAQWCWNGSHVITSISDTIVSSRSGIPSICQPVGTPLHWRNGGGVGSTWYETGIRADFYCGDPDHGGGGRHYHSMFLYWAHNGWGTSTVTNAWVYTYAG
jgi:hypothetical protein